MAELSENIVFFGINFRSGSHLLWFRMSMTILALTLLFMVFDIIFGDKKLIQTTMGILKHITNFHGGVAFCAVIATRFGKENGRIYSVDCI